MPLNSLMGFSAIDLEVPYITIMLRLFLENTTQPSVLFLRIHGFIVTGSSRTRSKRAFKGWLIEPQERDLGFSGGQRELGA